MLHNEFWVVAALALGGELLPIRTSRISDAQCMLRPPTAFVFAILYVWGPWPALLVEAVATLLAAWVHRLPLWETLFRPAASVIALAAAWTTMAVAGLEQGLESVDRELRGVDLLWVISGWVLWYVVDLQMERWIAQAAGRRLYPASVAEVGYDVVTCAAVCRSPR